MTDPFSRDQLSPTDDVLPFRPSPDASAANQFNRKLFSEEFFSSHEARVSPERGTRGISNILWFRKPPEHRRTLLSLAVDFSRKAEPIMIMLLYDVDDIQINNF